MTPRPNWATRPLTVILVVISTRVPSPCSVMTAVTVAEAFPCPRASRPAAFSTARWAASSFSTKDAVPLYWAVIGPTLTLTSPW